MHTINHYLFVMLITMPVMSQAQIITGIGTKWNDAFSEWAIYTHDELEGDISLRWDMVEDWTQWDYRIGEVTGSIETKWRNDFSQWEVRGGDEIITIRMVWPNDIREWRLTDNTITLTLKSRWGNNLNEWHLKSDNHGTFNIFTSWENDPREWNVRDGLDDDISIHMKVALVFLSTFNSFPKN